MQTDEEDDVFEEPPLLTRNEAWVHREVDRLTSRLPQRTGKDRRTEGEVFDQKTLLALHRLLRSGVLRSVDFPVSTGKEANVFRGTTPGGGLVAIKVYRVNTATFRHVLEYIAGDERFEGVGRDRRGLVHVWAQKEFRNLHDLRGAGVPVPEPIRVLDNVLIMEYIGVPEGPWPTLKAVGDLPEDVARRFWDELSSAVVAMHAEGLVHADLSEFNVLVEGADDLGHATPRIIDVGQGVPLTHPQAREYLARDVGNLVRFFRKQGLDVSKEALMARMEAPT